jgi:GNAT superfamily N-acetyltransferase
MLALRDARLTDAARLAVIHQDARAQAMPWLPVLHDEADTRAWLRDHVLAAMTVCVACDGDEPIGYMALDGELLDQLYVAPGHQGRGVGSALLAEAWRLRPGGFSLWVFARNARARSFYERHGLVVVEETDGAANEENEPDVRYAWRGIDRKP